MTEQSSVRCPHCGGIVTVNGVTIDGVFVKMAPHEQRVWRALADREGELISGDEIAKAVGSTRINNIHVAIYGLRRLVQDIGYEIETQRGKGYRLRRRRHDEQG